MLNCMRSSFTYGIQLSDGLCSKTWDQVQAEGRDMRWLRTGHGSLCLEESHQWAHSQMNLHLFTSSTRVRTSFCFFIQTTSKFGSAEHIKYPKADPNAVKSGTQLVRKSSAAATQEQPPRPSSATGNVVQTTSSFQQAADPEEVRRAVSPPNTRGQRPSPNGLPLHPASLNGRTKRVIGGDDDVESSTEPIIRERALSPDQVRALSPPARGGTPPTGPVGIESMVKTVQQQQRSESPLVERERTKSPESQNYGQQQPNLASANGIIVHSTKAGSASSITTDLIRDVKARDAELETLRRREAWMRAALAQALHAGFVYVNASSSDEDRGITDDQPKIAEAVITLKKLHGRIQVRNLALPMWPREVELRTGESYRTGTQRLTAH